MDKQLFNTWRSINQKCYNPNNSDYCYYGEKGITICNEWEEYNDFVNWALNNGYNKGLVLSRKDTDDDYKPSNCEWITDLDHRAKRGKTGRVEYIDWDKSKITLAELSKIVGIHFNTLRSRYLAGRRGNELVMKPNRRLRVLV